MNKIELIDSWFAYVRKCGYSVDVAMSGVNALDEDAQAWSDRGWSSLLSYVLTGNAYA